jgi:hypothetical protein
MGGAEQRMAVIAPYVHEGIPLAVAAAAAGVPRRTAHRWLSAYLASGAAGLTRSGRSGLGCPAQAGGVAISD